MDLNKPIIKTFSASGDLNDPMLLVGKAGEFDLQMDQPQSIGGTNKGPAPLDLLTASFIGCVGITFAKIARQKKFEYAGARFEASGDVDVRGYLGVPGICRHFCRFEGAFIIETRESEELLKEVADQVENTCPVYNLFKDAGIDVRVEWRKK